MGNSLKNAQKPPERLNNPVCQQIVYPNKEVPVSVDWFRGKCPANSKLAYHHDMEFQFIKRGTGAYFIGDKNYPFRKNSLLIVRPREIHNFIPQAGCFVEKGSLIFPVAYVNKFQKPHKFSADFPRHLSLSEAEAMNVEMLMNQIHAEASRREPYWREMLHFKLREFLCLLKRICLRPELPPLENPIVARLIAYVEQNYSRPVKISGLADEFGFSHGHLTRLFAHYTGMGLKRYLLQRRIIEGKTLMENQPGLKLAAIAELVGFNDFAVFNRAFRIFTGMTPAAFREISSRGIKR